jgi:hypothetical protein
VSGDNVMSRQVRGKKDKTTPVKHKNKPKTRTRTIDEPVAMPDLDADIFCPDPAFDRSGGWKGMAWKPLHVQRSVTVSGGHANDHLIVDALEIDSAVAGGRDDDTFIRLDKNAEWLLKVVGGKDMKKGGLARSRVVSELRDKVASGGESISSSPQKSVSSSPQKGKDVADDRDFMDELDTCQPENVFSLKHKKPSTFTPKRHKQQVVVVTMSLHALDRSSGRERNVRLLATSTNSVWISQEDIPWLVCYMTDEIMKGGVVVSETDDRPALDINTFVPNLNVQWDFASGDLWIAEFVAGDLKGQKVSSSVKELSQSKWASVGGDKHFGVTLAKAPFKVRKDALYTFICAACQKMVDEHVAGDPSSGSAAPSG